MNHVATESKEGIWMRAGNGLLMGACLTAAVLAGCSDKVRTAEWYAGHLDAADERARWCVKQAQAGELPLNPENPVAQDCRNAVSAIGEATAKRFMGQ